MICSIGQNPGTGKREMSAPNGEASILFEHIKRAIPADYQPDLYVLAAYKEGHIKDFSRDEVAVALWSKLYTKPVQEVMKGWDGSRFDKNGEPLFSFVQANKLIGLEQTNQYYFLSGVKGSVAFVRGLLDKGLIYKWGNEYRLTDGAVLASDERSGEQQRMMQIKQMLTWMGVPEGYAVFEEMENGGIRVKFTDDVFNVMERIEEYHDEVNTRRLVGYLAERFPDLKVKFVSEAEARAVWEARERKMDKSGKVIEEDSDFARVNSFAHNGVVYLVEGRVTDMMAVEEVLHPFVYTMAMQNKELFDELVVAGKEDFKDLWKSIKRMYTDEAGYSEEERERELVTKALRRVMTQEGGGAMTGSGSQVARDPSSLGMTASKPSTDSQAAKGAAQTERGGKRMKGLLGRVMEWFMGIVKELGRVLGDVKGKVLRDGKGLMKGGVMKVGELKRGIGFSDIAKLLNGYDAQFFVDARKMGMAFNQIGTVGDFQRALMKKANKLQQKILGDLLRPADRARFVPDQKSFVSESGKLLEPLSSAITGSEKDMQGKAGLRFVFGKNLQGVMEALALGEPFSEVEDLIEAEQRELAKQAYMKLRRKLNDYANREVGDVVVPLMVVADHGNKVADLLDFVVVKADGGIVVMNVHVSQTSIEDDSYIEDVQEVEGRSKLKGRRLNEWRRRGLKAAGRRRLLENNGYTVDRVVTLSLHVPTEEEQELMEVMGKDVYDISLERTWAHGVFDNRRDVNELFPIMPADTGDKVEAFKRAVGWANPTRQPGFLSEEDRMPEGGKVKDPLEEATVRKGGKSGAGKGSAAGGKTQKEEISEKQKQVAKQVNDLVNSVKMKPKSEMVLQMSKVLELLQHGLTSSQAAVAFSQFIGAAQDEVSRITEYLMDESRVTDPKQSEEYVRVAVEAEWYLKTFTDIGNLLNLHVGSDYQAKRLGTLNEMLKVLDSQVRLSLLNYVKQMVRTHSEENLTEADIAKIVMDEVEDLSEGDYWVRDLAGSKDKLLALADKMYKRQRYAQVDRMKEFNKLVDQHSATLDEELKKDPKLFDRFWEKTADGKKTGRILQRIGSLYAELLDKLESKVRTSEGLMKQYRDVESLLGAKPEDIEYNKKLFADNEAIKRFKEAETQTETGYSDGMYHRFVDEFMRERAKFEQYEVVRDDNGKFVRGQWVIKKDQYGNPVVSDALYRQYKQKYYEEIVYDKPVMDDNGVFTGTFIKKGGRSYVVKREFVTIREVAGDGTSMLSKEYEALKNDMSPTGRVLWSFFEFFVKEMEATNDLLPANAQQKMMGRMPLVRAKLMDEIKRSPNWFMAGVKAIGRWFSTRTYAKQAMYASDGTIANQIPIFFTGNLRNELLVEELQKELVQLHKDYKDKKIERGAYLDKVKELEKELHQAEKAPTADQLETDPREILRKYRDMAETYAHLNIIEGSVHAVLFQVGQRSYKRVNLAGKVRKNRATGEEMRLEQGQGRNSLAYKRYKKWMEMVFYNSQDLDAGTWEVVSKKLMKASSFVNVGLNTFGAIHNFAMASINTIIEAAGAMYFTRKAALEAGRLLTTDLLPGIVAAAGKGHGSKTEAIVDFFQVIQEGMGKEHKVSLGAFLAPGYKGMEIGEYAAQATSAIAYMLSHDLYNKKTGETVSIYDAFTWDKENGLQIKPEFKDSFTSAMKYNITYGIREMNKKIHGNYAWEDRMVIQSTMVGQLAAQYHKWVVPAYDQRFGKQGRYIAVYNLFVNMYRAQGNIFKKFRDAWKGQEEWELRGMYKNAAEIVFFTMAFAAYGLFHGLAKDTPRDKKNVKRWWNFLSWESDRVRNEILFWYPVVGFGEQMRLLKNPFAVFPTLDMFAAILKETYNIAAPPYNDEIYYDKGPFRGELKLKKEVFDMTPYMKDVNKWRSFSQVTSFYIK